MKVTRTQYNKAIKRCKDLMRLRGELKYEIAKISYQVCYSKTGGSMPAGCYSVTDFAKEISVGYKTLQRWRREYNLVVSKIGIKDPTKLKRKALESTLKKVGKGTSKAEVKKIYNSYKKNEKIPDDAYFLDIKKRIFNFRFAICHNYTLKKLDQEVLKDIHKAVKEINKALNTHFSKNKVPARIKHKNLVKNKVEMILEEQKQ